MYNQKGFVVESLFTIVIMALLFIVFFTGSRTNDEVTSGIAYNTTNNALISGNTNFSVRASESTYTTEENKSSYCLPPNSPYKDLVNKAAANKNVKITVSSSKYFAIKAPWVCQNNVTVTEVKNDQK